jgi:FG-GAP repeat
MNYPISFAGRIISAAVLSAIIAPNANAQVINEDAKILAFDGSSGDGFGHSSAIYNGLAVIGANGDFIGSAYLIQLVLDGQPIKLIPDEGSPNDLFGHSVDIGIGNIAKGSIVTVVGSPNHDDIGESSGAAYTFHSSGTQIHRLVPNDGATADNFGVSVAIDNGLIVVGAPEDDDNGIDSGSAYIFDATSGSQLTKLLPNNGAANDAFGHQVAISNGIIAVSALRHQNNGIETGSVYLFSALSGLQIAELSSNEGVPNEQFGYSLAIDNGLIAVGALATATAYTYDASTFAQIRKITPSTPGNGFGWSIDIDGNKVVVGALLDPINGVQSGSGYLFNAFTGDELAKLIPSDGAVFEQFGSAMAIDNDLVIVGARNDNDNGSSSGSAYFFDIFCPADLNGDGVLNFFDISLFLTAFNNQSPIADFNNDGFFNFFDVSAFLAAFSAGCP